MRLNAFPCRFQQIIGVHTLQAHTEQTKLTWLTRLQEAQEQWKSTLNQTVFRVSNNNNNNNNNFVLF